MCLMHAFMIKFYILLDFYTSIGINNIVIRGRDNLILYEVGVVSLGYLPT